MRAFLAAVLVSILQLGPTGATAASLFGQENITGGPLEAADGMVAQYVRLVFPAALAARAGEVYIADTGLGWVVRYERGTGRLAKILPAYANTRLALGADLSLYVLDVPGRAILRYSRMGQLLQRYADKQNLGLPIDFTLDERRNRVLVLDGAFNQVLVFNPFGRLEHVVSLAAAGFPPGVPVGMAFAHDELYVLDRAGRRVAVIDLAGRLLRSLGEGQFVEPGMIAVDHAGRVFVADRFDQSIKRLLPESVEDLSRVDKLNYLRLGDLTADEFNLLASDQMGGLVEVLRYLPDEGK